MDTVIHGYCVWICGQPPETWHLMWVGLTDHINFIFKMVT